MVKIVVSNYDVVKLLHNDMALLRKLKKCSIFELTSMQVQKKKTLL
jgi:hypothetical protein